MSDNTVMIVDDIESNRTLLKMILEDDYNIIESASGNECLETLHHNLPDIVLLDVNMPGITGYEVCTEIRKNKATTTLPIVFISAMDNVEERLAGFEAGGNDYITKPINPEHVLDRVKYFIEHQAETNQAKADANTAMQVAMKAINSSSELGQIIDFVKQSQSLHTLESIGEKFCAIAESFGLKATTLIHASPSIFVNCTPDSMEGRVLSKFKDTTERIVNIGVRTMISSEDMGVLISNMPIEDEVRYDRLKEHLAVLSTICEGRLQSIKAEISIKNQRKDILTRIIKMTEERIHSFSGKLLKHDDDTRQIMLQMIAELEAKLLMLGLDKDQEQQLMSLAYETSDRIEKMKNEANNLESSFSVILEDLYDALAKDS